ncbi:D-tyrosyl-tRNA(Tyr) deacylase [Haplosporangium gracile]|nr:D-tyrosyl-tRNA(Tyr) deacylase [Haplosporangium gracile]
MRAISKIRQGLCVLIGLSIDDTPADLDFMVKKLLSVRVFDSNQHALKTPGATMTSPPREQKERTQAGDETEPVKVEEQAKMWAKSVVDIEGEILCDGEFGAMMLVNIANDGPVTLELDSRKFEYLPITHQSNPAVFKALKASASPILKGREPAKQGKPGKPGKGSSSEKQDQEKLDKEMQKEEGGKEDVIRTVAGKIAEILTLDMEPTSEKSA